MGIKTIGKIVILNILAYLAISFVMNEFNTFEWDKDMRFGMVYLWVLITILTPLTERLTKDLNNGN